MKTLTKRFRRVAALLVTLAVAFGLLATNVAAVAFDPNQEYSTLGLKFTTEKPDLGFYINAAAKWELENIPELSFGTTAGEWTAMDLLRGMYTGDSYIKEIPADYFDKYIAVFEEAMIKANGTPHAVKYTEYSRLMLALSSLGYDVHHIAPHYRTGGYKGTVVPEGTADAKLYSYDIPLRYSVSTTALSRQGINGPIWVLIAMNTGNYAFYTRAQLQAGLDGTDTEIADKLAAYGVTKLENEGYTVNSRTGERTGDKGVATEGKLIDYILNKEITQTNDEHTVGGWALSGNYPDPDITGMALQALAPYYLDEQRFEAVRRNAFFDPAYSMNYTYDDLKNAVERAIYVMSKQQLNNGGFSSWGTTNSESVSQIIVALTALNIDPLAQNISLPTIGKTCNFRKPGDERDGVTTNNMIDNLLTFWDSASGSTKDIGGFKHVTMGQDGGGGSGTTVNAMATDQALYGLIAYDRYLKGKNSLYDMTDMTGGEYQQAVPKDCVLTFDGQKMLQDTTAPFAPYQTVELPHAAEHADYVFKGWNTAKDGSGILLQPGDTLSMPDRSLTLYAIWEPKAEAIEKAGTVSDLIAGIGSVTLDSKESVQQARAAYDALPESVKPLVTNYADLLKAEKELNALEKPQTPSETDPDAKPETKPETVPEQKPETKPETVPEQKPESKPEENSPVIADEESPKTGKAGGLLTALSALLAAGYAAVLSSKRHNR